MPCRTEAHHLGAGGVLHIEPAPRASAAAGAHPPPHRPGPEAARGGTLVDVATWNSTRVWLVASFLLVSAATALALAAWSVPAADHQFDRVERVAVVGSATDAAASVSRAAPSAVAPNLASVSRDDQVSLWLVGRDGRDIARSALPVLDRRALPGADAAVAAALDGRRTLPPDGSNVWVVALPVRMQSGERAALLAYATESGFGASASHVLHRQLLYGAAIALLAAFVIGLLIADRVSRRVQRIARAAEQIADGDFSEPLSDGFGDEIGVLAHSIDAMRERLAANFAAISSERQRLSAVLDELDEAVLTVAPDGRVEVANQATVVLLGDRPATADELLALLEPDAPPPLDARDRVWRLADGYISVHGRTLFMQVTPLPHADGEARLVVVADRTAEQQREETERRFSRTRRTSCGRRLRRSWPPSRCCRSGRRTTTRPATSSSRTSSTRRRGSTGSRTRC